ncbi:hypothetical protein B296_00019222 [Ensete ventricosum]|uniref:Aspartic peptidase DDI1-type domain-containing protein n=1 Tax=Ensete ventricosum TaxID=4639 RepID=A0A426XVK3_ENSVE|nr:hypothetical protein B296_00019222 [Ensete ventricosum]
MPSDRGEIGNPEHHCRTVKEPSPRLHSHDPRTGHPLLRLNRLVEEYCDLEITFRSRNEEYPDHDDALVISTRIMNAQVKMIMVDTGSSTDILYLDTFQKMVLTNKDLVPMTYALTGFTGDLISPLGTMTLPATIEEEPSSKALMVPFMVVGLSSAYNTIISRLTLNKLRVVVSTYHDAMKFLTRAGVGEARSDPRVSRQCYLMVTMLPKKLKTTMITVDPRDLDKGILNPELVKKVLEVPLNPEHVNKVIKVLALPKEQ